MVQKRSKNNKHFKDLTKMYDIYQVWRMFNSILALYLSLQMQ